MNRRLILAIVAVCFGCGVLAPVVTFRAHRARAIEAAMTHAVVTQRYLAARAVDRFADGDWTHFDLTPWITEPGVQAVWVVDATGRLLVQRGVVTPDEVAIAQHAIGQPDMVVRAAADETVWLAQSVGNRLSTHGTPPLGAVGCRFAPHAAVRAIGNPWGIFSYLLAIATASTILLLVIWHRTLQGSAEPSREAAPHVFSPHAAETDTDLSWAQAVVDVVALPVLVLDATHRLVAANGMVIVAGRGHALRRGMHWLDLVAAMGWGAAANGWVQTLERTPQRTLHCADRADEGTPHVDIVRVEQSGAIVGYWITLEGVPHDPAVG